MSSPKVTVLFDDYCRLCDRSVALLLRLDRWQVLAFCGLSQADQLLKKYNITKEDAHTDLHGIEHDTGNVARGFALYRMLARHLVLLWPAIPLLWLLDVTRLGSLIYGAIAARRRKIFGVCEPSVYRHNPPGK